jgi:hypothetical protein
VLTCKDTVRFKRFTPAMLHMLAVLGALADTHAAAPDPCVITSANDSSHDPHSRHYVDEALDLRTHAFATPTARYLFQTALVARLGPQFTVLLEDEGTENEHLHCQVRKGLAYIAV